MNLQRLAAAAFAAEALGMPTEATDLASDLLPVADGPISASWAFEVRSGETTLPFMVTAYAADAMDDDGVRGHEHFRTDLAIMREAASLATPGPRLVAQAESGEFLLTLTTTQAVADILSGRIDDAPTPNREERDAAARRLADALRAANADADILLRGMADDPALGPEERALQLHVLDEASMRHLLRLIQLLAS
ncbi:MAG: hypothetical protein ACKOCK_11650 [Chloroflexota bacterium]